MIDEANELMKRIHKDNRPLLSVLLRKIKLKYGFIEICEDCNHVYIAYDDDDDVFCPKCGS